MSTYVPKEIPEGINTSQRNTAWSLLQMSVGVMLIALVLYGLLGGVSLVLVRSISPEKELEMADHFSGNWTKKQTPKELRLQRILDALSQRVQLKRTPQVFISNDTVANAYIIPGGRIFVTEGLLQSVSSENELTFVMAHELGHFIYRDALKGLGRELLWIVVRSFFSGGGLSDALLSVDQPVSLVRLGLSREQESRADRFALEQVVNHYGHLAGTLDFFRKNKPKISSGEESVGRVLSYFQTHPWPEDRIQSLKAYANEKGWSEQGEIQHF